MESEYEITYWNSIKPVLKQKYPELTNSDLLWRHGTIDDLLWMISVKLGISRKKIQEIIDNINPLPTT